MPKTWSRKATSSEFINRKAAQEIFRAFDYAKWSGYPLNLYVVVVLHETESAVAATLFEDIRDRYRNWLNYRTRKDGAPLPPMYVYTLESPDGHAHVNWALHVPAHLQGEFKKKLGRWVSRVQGEVAPSDVHVQPIDLDYHKVLAKYVVKGIDPAYVEHFHLKQVHEPQGLVWGRRSMVSPALARTMRNRVGFKPPRGRRYPPVEAAFAAFGNQTGANLDQAPHLA